MRQVLTSKLHTSSNVTLYWKKHNKISSSSTHISLAWVPSLPLDALHRVYRSILGVDSVHMATPLRCVAVQLWHCQTTVHIPLACLCRCLFVLQLFLCAGRALPCYMQGSQDVSIDHLPTGQCSHPHPLPSPTPAVPTPTSAINIIYQYHIFFVVSL